MACSDPMEMELPRAGLYAVTDGAGRSELHTADKKLRTRYREHFEDQRAALATELQRLGIPMLQASTDIPSFSVLQSYYGNPRR